MYVFDLTAHKALWSWLADNTIENNFPKKQDWPGWEVNGGDCPKTQNDCFACQYIRDRACSCDLCPLVWPGASGECMVGNGLYFLWLYERTGKLKKDYARQIADLPVKDGVECI